MPDDPAFIRMIAAAPDDDAPRLVYADYLEETGDPAKMARAEFIRVQVEKARLVPDTPRWTELSHRDSTLMNWATRWRVELPAIDGVEYGGFVRGFVDHVAGAAGPLAQNLAQIMGTLPLRRLTLTKLNTSTARQLVKVAELAEVVELEVFAPFVAPAAVRAFVARGPWPRLRRLHFPYFDPEVHGRRRIGVANALRAAFGDRLI